MIKHFFFLTGPGTGKFRLQITTKNYLSHNGQSLHYGDNLKVNEWTTKKKKKTKRFFNFYYYHFFFLPGRKDVNKPHQISNDTV